MIIERLKYKDIENYKKLIDEVFDGSNDIEEYKKYDENANYAIIVAKENEEIIGSITFYEMKLFTFSFQPTLELFNVSVKKEYRDKGVATNIFNYIIDYAKENGFKSINLTCLDTAISAHKLYEKMGMTRTSSIKYNMSLR